MEDNNLSTGRIPSWCPGCGNHTTLHSFKKAAAELNVKSHELAIFHGIGCSGNGASLLKSYGFHALHGRAPSNAAGCKLANHKLKVVVFAGDGDLLSEGLTHLVHTARYNHDITVILHNNGRYGLTAGQTSPTTLKGTKTATHPQGSPVIPLDPISLLLAAGAKHLIRTFAGDVVHQIESIRKGLTHKGFTLIEVIQPCVIFNKEQNISWFRERIKKLETIPESLPQALEKAQNQETIYIGEFIKENSLANHETFEFLAEKTLIQQNTPFDLTNTIKEIIS
jgi:2-oxoglutarate/2-oxoacid ferredoxin oxidoreductase subunit beta